MSWFRKREKDSDRLLRAFLQTDAKRVEAQSLLDVKKQELEMRRLELEMEHVEQLGEERRKDAREKEANREARRTAAAAAREKLALKRRGVQPTSSPQSCRVCAEPSSPYLSADEIWWHGVGHPPTGPQPIDWSKMS